MENLKKYKWSNTRERVINFLVTRMSNGYKNIRINGERLNQAEMCLRVLNAFPKHRETHS